MNNYLSVKEIKVGINFGENAQTVGRLASHNHKIYFEYDCSFIKSGIEISPQRLPLQLGVQSFDYDFFKGLLGVFNDSPPDG